MPMPFHCASIPEGELLDHARNFFGPLGDDELLREGLKALIERESARALAQLGGTEPNLRQVERRRIGPA
jgi:hypothetical protein